MTIMMTTSTTLVVQRNARAILSQLPKQRPRPQRPRRRLFSHYCRDSSRKNTLGGLSSLSPVSVVVRKSYWMPLLLTSLSSSVLPPSSSTSSSTHQSFLLTISAILAGVGIISSRNSTKTTEHNDRLVVEDDNNNGNTNHTWPPSLFVVGWTITNSISIGKIVHCHDENNNQQQELSIEQRLEQFIKQQQRQGHPGVPDDNLVASTSNKDINDNDDDNVDDTYDTLPIYTLADVAQHNGLRNVEDDDIDDPNTNSSNNTTTQSIWISYDGLVYDITNFVQSKVHPGGSERLLRAAGKALEPYWAWHTQHFNTQRPLYILQTYCPVVGRLSPMDQQQIDDTVETIQSDLPYTIQIEWQMFGQQQQQQLKAWKKEEVTLSQLQHEYPQTHKVSRVGCPNNQSSRRPTYNSVATGVTLQDLGIGVVGPSSSTITTSKNDDPRPMNGDKNNNKVRIVGVTFHARDGENVSIVSEQYHQALIDDVDSKEMFVANPIVVPSSSSSLSPSSSFVGDILLCYEIDGAPITKQRGFPMRAIIPGKRVVKWVERIQILYAV